MLSIRAKGMMSKRAFGFGEFRYVLLSGLQGSIRCTRDSREELVHTFFTATYTASSSDREGGRAGGRCETMYYS